MINKRILFLLFLALASSSVYAQTKVSVLENLKISNSKVVKLGHIQSLEALEVQPSTSREKKAEFKRKKSAPANFKGRRGESKAINKEIEHQGEDQVLQRNNSRTPREVTPFVNIDGIGDYGSPHDPSGDVSDQYYVQMVNTTDIGIFSLSGDLLKEFSANTLWAEFNQTSAGDPIVLFDEFEGRWILTEFSSPANLLIAISDDGNPMGGYTAYNFTTPNFPDYPKYSISPDILVLTTNEEGGSSLHNYFFDLKAMYRSESAVDMQRIEIEGNQGTESGFYVTTPVDWNGLNLPFDNRPMTVRINDSSWFNGPEQDQIEIFSFDIDFSSQLNTRVTKTAIVTAPFDSFPCSRSGFQFACIPQKDGSGLDGVPEVIMNVPHLRNFLTHESMVLSFISDAAQGANRSGIRWVELRRSDSESSWELYQEGTYAPNDGLDRFLPSIAMDSEGNIGLAYNVSSPDIYVGARFTGRRAIDPLGLMTVEEFNLVDGKATINSGERFGDYSHMSVAPYGDDTFWWTSEYAGEGSSVTQTRIAAFEIRKDSFDLAMRYLLNPSSGSNLTDKESVTVSVVNSGIKNIKSYEVELLARGKVIGSKTISSNIEAEESQEITFDSLYDFSEIQLYDLTAVVIAEEDQNYLNDTLKASIRHLHRVDVALSASVQQGGCYTNTISKLKITGNGETPIDECWLSVNVNGEIVDTIIYEGSLSFQQSARFQYNLTQLREGQNTIIYEIIAVNGEEKDDNEENDIIELSSESIASDYFVTLEFKTDFYPRESTWEIRTESQNSLVANGGFTEGISLTRQDICINKDSCYVLIVKDSQGDGICCGFGLGSFSLYNNEGFLLFTNDGEFGSETRENFCGQELACTFNASLNLTNASSAITNDGMIIIETSSGIGPFFYSIDGGNTFQENGSFPNLFPGEYQIIIKDQSGLCQKSETASIGITSSLIEYDGQFANVLISPNPSSDLFKVRISGLDIPEHMLKTEILDFSGRVLQERKISKYSEGFIATFSLYDYPEGTYLFRIKGKGFTHMSKIIKTQ